MAVEATEAFLVYLTFRCFNLIRTGAMGIVIIVRLDNTPAEVF